MAFPQLPNLTGKKLGAFAGAPLAARTLSTADPVASVAKRATSTWRSRTSKSNAFRNFRGEPCRNRLSTARRAGSVESPD